MMLDKTEKGREEISTRQYHLSARIRTLLLLVDGKHDIDHLLEKVSGLGLGEESITELIESGFIYDTTPAPITEPVPEPPSEEAIATREQKQLDLLYDFYTDTIKNAVGLRGYAFQSRVERAKSLEDFRELRIPFLEVVLKALGDQEARKLRDQLDPLLNGMLPAEKVGTINS